MLENVQCHDQIEERGRIENILKIKLQRPGAPAGTGKCFRRDIVSGPRRMKAPATRSSMMPAPQPTSAIWAGRKPFRFRILMTCAAFQGNSPRPRFIRTQIAAVLIDARTHSLAPWQGRPDGSMARADQLIWTIRRRKPLFLLRYAFLEENHGVAQEKFFRNGGRRDRSGMPAAHIPFSSRGSAVICRPPGRFSPPRAIAPPASVPRRRTGGTASRRPLLRVEGVAHPPPRKSRAAPLSRPPASPAASGRPRAGWSAPRAACLPATRPASPAPPAPPP